MSRTYNNHLFRFLSREYISVRTQLLLGEQRKRRSSFRFFRLSRSLWPYPPLKPPLPVSCVDSAVCSPEQTIPVRPPALTAASGSTYACHCVSGNTQSSPAARPYTIAAKPTTQRSRPSPNPSRTDETNRHNLKPQDSPPRASTTNHPNPHWTTAPSRASASGNRSRTNRRGHHQEYLEIT